MKKKVSLMIIVLVGICMLLLALFQRKDIEIDDIIWTTYDCDKNGNIYGGTIYSYSDGKRRRAEEIALCNVSMKGEDLLVGVQNLYPSAEGFKGIINFNVSLKEVTEILNCDKVYDFLDNESPDFYGNIQMTKDGKFYYFVCGKKMVSYDMEKDKLEILFETSCYQYVLNEKETYIYFSENGTLFRYDLLKKTKDILTDGVNNFTISKDEKIIIYENRKEQGLFLYQMNSGGNERLLDLNYLDSQISISEDNRYLLYTDFKESVIPTNRRIKICVLELATGKQKVIYRGNYRDNIRSVLWCAKCII